MRGKIGIVRGGKAMIKILKMISKFIFRKVSHKNKKQILGSVGDGTLNVDVSETGIEGTIVVSEIHPKSVRFFKHTKDNNKIIYIKDYLK